MAVFLFGSTVNVGTDDFLATGNVGTESYTYSGADAIIEEIHIILRANGLTNDSLKLGLYDDVGTAPNNLLLQGTILGNVQAAGEYVLSGLSFPIASGALRHLACVAAGNNLTFTGPAGPPNYREKSGTAGVFPNPYGGGGASGGLIIPIWAMGSVGTPDVSPDYSQFPIPKLRRAA